MRNKNWLAPSLALPLACALALVAPQCAQAGSFHGVVAQGALRPADYDRMGRGNVGTLRVRVDWASIEPTRGDRNWGRLDRIVDRAAASGLRVLPSLDGPAPSGLATPPTDRVSRRAFARFAGALAGRYGGRIRAYQIYNEQNGPTYWGARPNPRAYGKLLKAAAKKITRRDRRAEIVLGGMFGTPSGSGAITSWSYLRKLYRVNGVRGAFDTVAIHPYSPTLRGISYQIRKVRNVIAARSDGGAKLRITELGWGSARHGNLNAGRRGQARMLKKAFRLFERERRAWNIRGVNWFSWRDNPEGACSFCQSSGLLKANRDPKLSWSAFKQVAR